MLLKNISPQEQRLLPSLPFPPSDLLFDKNQLDFRVRELTAQLTAIQADR
jgi:hypothetical protein